MRCFFFFIEKGKGHKIFLCLIFMFSIISLRAQQSMGNAEKISPFSLTDRSGNFVSFQDFEGELFVLDFWATWCAPCIKSIPAMQQVEKEFQENPDVVFLYVNTLEFQNRDTDFIDKFLKDKGLEFVYYLDKGNGQVLPLSKSLDIRTLPSKLIVSKNGDILFRDFGYSGSAEELISHMQELIFQFLSK